MLQRLVMHIEIAIFIASLALAGALMATALAAAVGP
jgi:hypothetical protein